ncbi:hypothetical protein NRIC_37600 [Enterococcus florum]|uniref:Uncharacterized protein n=1 Tax=Enterococcus florum TaxID=2480627 RepID=A0A4V0WQ24_9ENTE|nr:hypothetical protein [Enterococcus florum]GCF95869.1 hypothetical protein NRIC_37600 [Enterococcus florum]
MADEKKNRINDLYDTLVDPEEMTESTEPVETATVKSDEIVEETSPKQTEENKKRHSYSYYKNRENNYQDLLTLISDAERELADLKFRKILMESDFETLLNYYREVFLTKEREASAIAKGALLEYFTFELLRPLESRDLHLSNQEFSTWETKNFTLSYRLIDDNYIVFQLMMPTSDGKIRTEKIKLMTVYPETMRVEVLNDAVLTLLKDCYEKHIYTSGQNSIFSYQMNEVFSNMKELGFEMKDNLLDNSGPLSLSFRLPHKIRTETLDDIFITTMNDPKLDFKKLEESQYLVKLENQQTVQITEDEKKETSILILDTADNNKSLIEFFGAYPFLVALTL